jgi:putative endonuclease
MKKGGCIYILTNSTKTTLYVGVTSNLLSRIIEHKEKKYPFSFSARYNLNKLVYYEAFNSITEAISREKQLKGGSRSNKIDLIKTLNPNWVDLYDEIKKW